MGRWTPARRTASLWAALITLAVAGLGGLATELGPWYYALRQPPWKPPDLWFGPAWTLIYTLTAASAVLCWEADPSRAGRRRLAWAYGLNAALNLLWSLFFFTWRRPDLAFVELLLLWGSILVLIRFAWPRSRRAAVLLLPYLLWVGFAGALNLAVVRLNGPFSG